MLRLLSTTKAIRFAPGRGRSLRRMGSSKQNAKAAHGQHLQQKGEKTHGRSRSPSGIAPDGKRDRDKRQDNCHQHPVSGSENQVFGLCEPVRH